MAGFINTTTGQPVASQDIFAYRQAQKDLAAWAQTVPGGLESDDAYASGARQQYEQKFAQLAQMSGNPTQTNYVGDDGRQIPLQPPRSNNPNMQQELNEAYGKGIIPVVAALDSGDRGRPSYLMVNPQTGQASAPVKGSEPGTEWMNGGREAFWTAAAVAAAAVGIPMLTEAGTAATGASAAGTAGSTGGAYAGTTFAGESALAGAGTYGVGYGAAPAVVGTGAAAGTIAGDVGAGAGTAPAAAGGGGGAATTAGTGAAGTAAAAQAAGNAETGLGAASTGASPLAGASDPSLMDTAAGLARQYGSTAADWASKLLANPSLLSSLAGGVAGALGGGDQTITTTGQQKTTPNDPASIQAAIAGLLGQANGPAPTSAVNPYASAQNPFLDQTIDAANRGTVRNYNTLSAPKFASGSSYGSSGLGFLEENERANVTQQLADNSNQLSYQGYSQAANLSESGAQRTDQMTLADLQRRLAAYGAAGQLGMGMGNTVDSSQSYTVPGNIWASGLGGAILGGKLGQSIFGTTKPAP